MEFAAEKLLETFLSIDALSNEAETTGVRTAGLSEETPIPVSRLSKSGTARLAPNPQGASIS